MVIETAREFAVVDPHLLKLPFPVEPTPVPPPLPSLQPFLDVPSNQPPVLASHLETARGSRVGSPA